jgi:ATP-binding cassette, subfamily B, bacterial MsbA
LNKSIFKDQVTDDQGQDSLQDHHYTTWEVVRRIAMDHLRPRTKLIAVSLISMFFIAITTGAVPFLIQTATDEVFENRNETYLYLLPIAVILVTVIKSIAEYVSKVTEAYIGQSIVADLRLEMFRKLTEADLSWLQRTHSGRFVSSFLNDSNIILRAASTVLVAIGKNTLMVIVLGGSMFWMDWRLATITALLTPIGIVTVNRQRDKMRKSATSSLQEMGNLGSLISQTLSGIRVVKAYRQEEREVSRADDTIKRTIEFIMRSVRARALSAPITETLTGIGMAGAIFYAGYQGIQGNVTIGHFVGFMTAALLAYQPLKALATLHTTLQEGVAAANRIFGIIDEEVKVREEPDARPLVVGRGEIVFDKVNFSYNDGTPVLRDFTLTVPSGATVAIVGPSGAGKSTILNLLLRFFDPSSGSIRIDGQDISHVTIESLRGTTALVTQEPFLFDDTITANIAYGKLGATAKDIEKAAKMAAADEFIELLPQQYDTRVGEAGSLLSGGERQRIAFARAMLKASPILLLDEATSSLDGTAERKVQKALSQIVKGRTVLMIAHRLSTVQNADIICVLDHGRIVEVGRHGELVDKGGVYSELYSSQFEASSGEASEKTPKRRKTRRKVAATENRKS